MCFTSQCSFPLKKKHIVFPPSFTLNLCHVIQRNTKTSKLKSSFFLYPDQIPLLHTIRLPNKQTCITIHISNIYKIYLHIHFKNLTYAIDLKTLFTFYKISLFHFLLFVSIDWRFANDFEWFCFIITQHVNWIVFKHLVDFISFYSTLFLQYKMMTTGINCPPIHITYITNLIVYISLSYTNIYSCIYVTHQQHSIWVLLSISF